MNGEGLHEVEQAATDALEKREFVSVRHFPPEWHRGIREAIKEGITEGIKAHCRIPLSSEECNSVGFLFEGIRDLGDGSTHRGVDAMMDNHRWLQKRRTELSDDYEENHKWVKKTRLRMEKVSTRIGMIIVSAVVLGVISLVIGGVAGWVEAVKSTPPVP